MWIIWTRLGPIGSAIAGLVALAPLVVAPSASALFIPVSDEREVYAEFSDPYFSETIRENPPAPFVAWRDLANAGGAYLATIDSEAVTATRMAASGETSGGSEFGQARSTFSITFDVDVATPYSLTGNLTENALVFNTSSAISLTAGATTIFSAEADGNSVDFADAGVLAPGQYTLLAESRWFDNVEIFGPPTTYDFVLAVPEPGTGALVAAGLGIFAARAGRRARRVSFSRS